MFNIGPQELLVVLIVALIIVGPKRLPELGRTIGRGLNEFRKIQDEVKDMVKFDLGADPADADVPDVAPSFDDTDETPRQLGDGDDTVDIDIADDGDGMTHSERVIAAMGDEDDDQAEAAPESVVSLDRPVDDTDPGSASDVPPAAAAE